MTAHYRLPSRQQPTSSVTVAASTDAKTVPAALSPYRGGLKRALDTLAILLSLPVVLPAILLVIGVAAFWFGFRDVGDDPPPGRRGKIARGDQIAELFILERRVGVLDQPLSLIHI